MSHFFDYSKYYNLLYRDKNYSEEANYIESIVKDFSPNAKQLLDVGCGTGNHAKLLAAKGFTIHGVDLSDQMLEIAKSQAAPNTTFSKGNIQSFQVEKKFEVAVSLFHVMSYQTSNEAVVLSFKTIHKHLKEDGIFIFDCWYGPGVLSDLPGVRVKRMEDERLRVIRVSEPIMDFNASTVEVNFEVNAFDKHSKELHTINEKHPMRYFFVNELNFFAEQCGFKIEATYAWLTKSQPSKNSWYITIICRKHS